MKVNQTSINTVKFVYETNCRFPALKDLRKHIVQYGASIVRGHGLHAYIGGHHVAVMQDGIRLALITSETHPDFN